MFRRLWTGLPEDPVFPSDLKELGYFVNEDDEIRLISDPKFYFDYFISKSTRYNDRQRFAFSEAISDLVTTRLADLCGLTKLTLPLDATPGDPHVPIFVSPDLASKSRVVVVFGEPEQELGVVAHRVLGGPGGVNKGSMVSIVQAIQQQRCSETDDSAPGVVLANTGELFWWPEGKKALSPRMRHSVPMRSAVHLGVYYDREVNAVPGNETTLDHVRYVFENVAGKMVEKGAKVDVIGCGDGAEAVEKFLDANWDAWGARLGSFAILGGYLSVYGLKSEGFKNFLKEKTRAYINSTEPLDTPLSGPGGNDKTVLFTQHGCPVFSAGEAYLTEMLLITAHPIVLKWMQEVALTSDYVNPEFVVKYEDKVNGEVEWATPEAEGGASNSSGIEVITRDEFEQRQKAAGGLGQGVPVGEAAPAA